MALQICDLKMVEKCRRPSVSVVGCFHPGGCHWMLDYIAWTFYLSWNVQRQYETHYIALQSPTQVIRSDPSPLLWAPQATATYPHFLAWQKKTRSLHRQAPDFPMASYSVLNLGVEACVHCRVLIPCCRVPSIQLFLSGFFDFLAIRSMCPVKLCGSKAHVLLFTKLCGGLSLKGRTICFLGKLVES
jgi:hypothetical protein